MCRLLGIRANGAVDLQFSLVGAPRSFSALSEENPHGWGMGWYEHGEPHLYKEPSPAADSEAFHNQAVYQESDLFICHVRFASVGAVSRENSHPFRFGNWLFAHNGSLSREPLLEALEERYQAHIEGQTDSEVYFYWLLQHIDQEKDVVRGIQAALLGVRDCSYSGLNFLLSDGETLYAYRDAAFNWKYYSLYFLERNPREHGPERFSSRETAALIQSKALRGEKAVLVCSEKLTDEDEEWREIPLGSLLIVSPGLEMNLVDLREGGR